MKNKLPEIRTASRTRSRSALSLEALEDRRCLSVSADFAGGVLNITGDRGSDIVSISTRDDGDILLSTNNGRLVRMFDGEDMDEIRLDLGNGANRVNIDLSRSNDSDGENTGFGENPSIHIITGNDADQITLNLGDDDSDGGGGSGDDNGRGDVDLSFDLGAGRDRLN